MCIGNRIRKEKNGKLFRHLKHFSPDIDQTNAYLVRRRHVDVEHGILRLGLVVHAVEAGHVLQESKLTINHSLLLHTLHVASYGGLEVSL